MTGPGPHLASQKPQDPPLVWGVAGCKDGMKTTYEKEAHMTLNSF